MNSFCEIYKCVRFWLVADSIVFYVVFTCMCCLWIFLLAFVVYLVVTSIMTMCCLFLELLPILLFFISLLHVPAFVVCFVVKFSLSIVCFYLYLLFVVVTCICYFVVVVVPYCCFVVVICVLLSSRYVTFTC